MCACSCIPDFRDPVMLGEGKFATVFSVIRIVAGTYLHGRVRERMRPVRGAALAPVVSTD
jgi:hypothetical protein